MSVTDGGIDQSYIPPSVTVDDDTKQNAVLALYCEASLRIIIVCKIKHLIEITLHEATLNYNSNRCAQ